MSGGGRPPLFLARRSYRLRRLMDAARLLPLLAAFLFLLPLLWDSREGRATAGDGIYLIVAWAGLILASFLISRRLAREAGGAPAPDGDDRWDPGRDPGATAPDEVPPEGPSQGSQVTALRDATAQSRTGHPSDGAGPR